LRKAATCSRRLVSATTITGPIVAPSSSRLSTASDRSAFQRLMRRHGLSTPAITGIGIGIRKPDLS
jgi:carbamoylphosphate synthase large subunit